MRSPSAHLLHGRPALLRLLRLRRGRQRCHRHDRHRQEGHERCSGHAARGGETRLYWLLERCMSWYGIIHNFASPILDVIPKKKKKEKNIHAYGKTVLHTPFLKTGKRETDRQTDTLTNWQRDEKAQLQNTWTYHKLGFSAGNGPALPARLR